MEFLAYSPAALTLMLLILAVSVMGFYSPRVLRALVFHPFSVIRKKKIYLLVTSGFLHADLGHLILNLIVFYFFAFPLNYMIGNEQFLLIFFVSLIGSHLTSLIKYRNQEEYYSLGASGAIAGLLFAFILFNPDARIAILLIPVGIPAPIFALLYMAYSIFQARRGKSHINHEAHLWGAVFGFFTAFFLNWNYFIFKIWDILSR